MKSNEDVTSATHETVRRVLKILNDIQHEDRLAFGNVLESLVSAIRDCLGVRF